MSNLIFPLTTVALAIAAWWAILPARETLEKGTAAEPNPMGGQERRYGPNNETAGQYAREVADGAWSGFKGFLWCVLKWTLYAILALAVLALCIAAPLAGICVVLFIVSWRESYNTATGLTNKKTI